MNHYSTTEARKKLSQIVNQVKYGKIIISIGRRDEEEVWVVPKPERVETLPISEINATSPSFNFLEDEPDLYSSQDLKKRYV